MPKDTELVNIVYDMVQCARAPRTAYTQDEARCILVNACKRLGHLAGQDDWTALLLANFDLAS
jgi:hypothetical protein